VLFFSWGLFYDYFSIYSRVEQTLYFKCQIKDFKCFAKTERVHKNIFLMYLEYAEI
jgi:hypothetical protein